MKTVATLQQLPQLFSYADVLKFTPHAHTFLARGNGKGLISRLARGVYINSFLKGYPSVEEAACFLRSPSYISCEWALHYHGVIIQVPVVCTILTLSTAVGTSRHLAYRGTTIEFSHLSPELFTGFETKDGFNMAGPEKALLDAVYLRKTIPFSDELDMPQLNRRQLEKLSALFPGRVRKALADLLSGLG
jgi:predicted transcriptional regulator of viral defense system